MSGHTPGPWLAFNMIHGERGDQMTPEEIAEYVANAVRKSIEDGGSLDRFLFISVDGDGPDICHVGNGPRGAANARLIAAAPDLLEACEGLVRFAEAVRMSSGMGKTQLAGLEAAKAAILRTKGQPA